MPRDIPVGNGSLLINFDDRYQLRDLYYPHVGQENHAGTGPCRFGVWAGQCGEGDDRLPPQLAWTGDKGWSIEQKYLDDALTTDVRLGNAKMKLGLVCNECVDFHRNVFVRRITVKNEHSRDRLVKVLHQQDFAMYGTRIGDTAYYDPELKGLVHYRSKRYLMATFMVGGEQRVDEYATGTSGFGGAEGTWRDAEDGQLGMNAIAQGAVDSTIAAQVRVPAGGEATVYFMILAGQSREELERLNAWLDKLTPQRVLDRTTSYWQLWTSGPGINFGDLPENVVDLFNRSLLTVRTQIDNGGAILAANDSDIMQFARDTYSYVWPRDGALVADALDLAGYSDLARSFYTFCQKTIEDEGYFLHKYNPDGSPASSWHPWIKDGRPSLPIQEDETALVVWSLWRHYVRYRDLEFVRPLWIDVVVPAADFMCAYRDENTGLPKPSYDLWEERYGVHAFTVGTVYGGLDAAAQFAEAFGETDRAAKYRRAANEVRDGAAKHLWSQKHNRFARRLMPRETHQIGNTADLKTEDLFEVDMTIDASLWAIPKFWLFAPDDPRVVATMEAVEERLWVKTDVGGIARYEDDYYHRVSDDIENVAGNPWFICTLWLADYAISKAETRAELKKAHGIFEWVANHALPSGVLAEQVNPYTNAPMSVSPLTWSHATVVSTVIKYLEKLEMLELADAGMDEKYQMRVPGRIAHRSSQQLHMEDTARHRQAEHEAA